MGYKEKFDAGESKALSHIIATKILRDLTDLRSKVETSTIAPRRWIWELIQNAKDVHPEGGVKIQIDFQPDSKNPHISFRHTGEPFTAENIRFLIEQISSKERKKDESGKRKTTGKFGTGFLSTHLLSEKVTIDAVAKEPEEDYRKFTLLLDRSGTEPDEITEAVHQAKSSVRNLDEKPAFSEYVEGEFNTQFHYPLGDTVSVKVAKQGLGDLDLCLPYSLIFVPEIFSVQILNDEKTFKCLEVLKTFSDGVQLVGVEVSGEEEFLAVKLSKNYTTILAPVEIIDNKLSFLPVPEQLPRLFCDFPLIGTEKFPFPVVINNPHFNPTDPRDGVFLTTTQRSNSLVDENKEIISEALELYEKLLESASSKKWKNLFNLAQVHSLQDGIDWVDHSWFKKTVLEPVRNKILYSKLVETASGSVASILNEGKHYTWFPSASKKEIRDEIWRLANYWFPHCLPKKAEVETWNRIAWSECGRLSTTQFSTFVTGQGSLTTLTESLKGIDVHEWLNSFYELIQMEEKDLDAIINKKTIFPNQNGNFCIKGTLFKQKEDIEDDFKDILALLGKDLRDILADNEIAEEFPKDRYKDREYVIREIISEVRAKVANRDIAKNYAPAFKKLLSWFIANPGQAEELFGDLYNNKHVLYDDEEISKSMAKSTELDELLADYSVSDVDALRELLSQNKENSNGLLRITQDILVSMGITSADEWVKALEDQDLAALFLHDSVPTPDMFFYAQGHIARAKKSIVAYLKTLSNYNIDNLYETAPTILGDIMKDGRSISIVVRPAYGGEVIIYYGSERDVLDFEESELWVDDGNQVRRISLGHILKTTQIRKFPI